MRTRATDHTPEAEPVTEHHADRNATLEAADRWIERHRRHGCTVEWMPHGRIIARHHRMPVAAVLIVELAETHTEDSEQALREHGIAPAPCAADCGRPAFPGENGYCLDCT